MSIIPLTPWLAHRHRRAGCQIDTVVLHGTDLPDADALVADLRKTNRSYHYLALPSGDVVKCVPYSSLAFHANNSYGPHEAAKGVNREQDARYHFMECTTVNDYSVAICVVAPTGTATKEQIQAILNLISELKTPLPKLRHLTTGAWVAPGQFEPIQSLDPTQLAIDSGLDLWFPG